MWFTEGDRVIYGPGSVERTGWHGTVLEGARPRTRRNDLTGRWYETAPLVKVRWDNGPTDQFITPSQLILLASAGSLRAGS